MMASHQVAPYRARRSLFALSTILCSGLAFPALAQVAATPPVRTSIDSNGVDLFLGTMNVDGPILSAGGGSQGISWQKFNHGGGWGDNLVATLNISGTTISVSFGTRTDRFTQSGTTYTPTEGNGSSLSFANNIYTYTTNDGTIAHFSNIYVGSYPYGANSGIITDITKPTGETLTYAYNSVQYCAATKSGSSGDICTQKRYAYRVSSVASNSNYKLNFVYGPYSNPGTAELPYDDFWTDWGNILGVSMSNLAIAGSSTRSQSFNTSSSGSNYYYNILDSMGRVTSYR